MNHLKVERDGRVVTVRLHRPHALNALSSELLAELLGVLGPLDRDPDVGCFVVTGSEKVFAAGADIREMAGRSAVDMMAEDYFAAWEDFADLRTPKIAAVAGYALGGGCELAMMCDLVVAGESALFGQPEIKLGVIPGIGGTQRLTRLVGRAKAMDLVLTGRTMDAREAERCGLVSRVHADVEGRGWERTDRAPAPGAGPIRYSAVANARSTPRSRGPRNRGSGRNTASRAAFPAARISRAPP
jgi:enoyl-CoA hydratase